MTTFIEEIISFGIVNKLLLHVLVRDLKLVYNTGYANEQTMGQKAKQPKG